MKNEFVKKGLVFIGSTIGAVVCTIISITSGKDLLFEKVQVEELLPEEEGEVF